MGHPRLVGLALAATVLVLAALVAAKLATRPAFRAHTGAAVRTCLRHQPAASGGLPSMPALTACLARHQTPRDDPLEATTGTALAALTVLEVRYLARRRRPTPTQTRTPR